MSRQQWTGEVIEENGELFLLFPEEMVNELGWEPGDVIVWDFPEGKNVVIARKARSDEL